MKNLHFLVIWLFMNTIATSQNKEAKGDDPEHEVKINVTNLILAAYLDSSYEYLINDEASLGLGVLVGLGDNTLFDEYRTFSMTPYFRQFFSRGYAKGFFVEGFGMMNAGKSNMWYDYEIYEDRGNQDKYTAFALGVSIGGKFLSKKGFIAEVNGGLGRNLFGTANFPDFVGRGGVSLGYRF